MSPRLALLPALAAAALAPSCVFHLRGHDSCLRVNGVELEERHEETIAIDAWSANGLSVEAALGDLSFEPTDGPSRVVAILHEREIGDASLSYEDGRLVVDTRSGDPAAIGDVTIFVHGDLPTLTATTGSGDVTVRGLHVTGKLIVTTGMGDVDVIETTTGDKVVATSGMGDVTLRHVDAGSITAESGMGDVSLRNVAGALAALSSGMGDVTLTRCDIEQIDAETGMGDVAVRESTYERADLDTGLGSVKR